MENGSNLVSFANFNRKFKCKDDNLFTLSSTEQKRVEDIVSEEFARYASLLKDDPTEPLLKRETHVDYLRKGLFCLSTRFESLDASRPWLVYWILHSLSLLNEPLPEEHANRVVEFLKSCQHEDGGYGGGPGQLGHLATTYAAVMALCTIGTKVAFNSINRERLSKFLVACKRADGGFGLHAGGETDARGAYCALAVATLTNTLSVTLVDGTAEWIISCQTYEGGFGACAEAEAHGGYTFCALATLLMLGRQQLVHAPALLRWLAAKHMAFEGGFQGRTNKLVDGCYSFWQAACFPLIRDIVIKRQKGEGREECACDGRALQNYVLVCCQSHDGGLVDKPGKKPDYYHTCYTLSGLSIAQHMMEHELSVAGSPVSNTLIKTHPVYNIVVPKEEKARMYFTSLDSC